MPPKQWGAPRQRGAVGDRETGSLLHVARTKWPNGSFPEAVEVFRLKSQHYSGTPAQVFRCRPFKGLIKQIIDELGLPTLPWDTLALRVLQEASELRMIELFADGAKAAENRKTRGEVENGTEKTLLVEDIRLARKVRGVVQEAHWHTPSSFLVDEREAASSLDVLALLTERMAAQEEEDDCESGYVDSDEESESESGDTRDMKRPRREESDEDEQDEDESGCEQSEEDEDEAESESSQQRKKRRFLPTSEQSSESE
jgi:histone H3/H4